MPNANKQKGTAFESAVRDLAKSKGLHALRPAQAGTADMGDVHLAGMVTLQCKDVANQAYTAWLADVAEQKVHAQLPFGVVIHKTRRASIAHARVVMHGDIAQKRGTYPCPHELRTRYKSCRTPIKCDKSKNAHDRSRCSHANAHDHHTTTHIPQYISPSKR